MEKETNLIKATNVFVRLGASDCVITKEQWQNDFQPEDVEFHLIGFEDEEGRECSEDGTYLDQKFKYE